MKLTCVTAVFNAVKSGNRDLLVRCVESIAKLTTEHEHLIYDGASTDGTVELLRELEVKMPGLRIVSEPDTGLYNALNKGVRDARGDWFYVLGCDDYVYRPEVMDSLIARTPSGTDVTISTVMRDDGPWFASKDQLKRLLFASPYIHQGFLIKTKVVRQVGGFDERWRISADFDQSWKLHLAGYKIRYYFEPYSFFTLGGLSSNHDRLMQDVCAIQKKHLRLTDQQLADLRDHQIVPIATCLRFLVHSDYALRTSARYCIRFHIRKYLRLALYPIVVVMRPVRSRKN